jgi:hypothetical protein
MTDDIAIPVILEDIERNLVELEAISENKMGHFERRAAGKYHKAVAALRDAFDVLRRNPA